MMFTPSLSFQNFKLGQYCKKYGRKSFSRHLTTNILVVGKKNGVEPWIAGGISEYEKRLRPLMTLTTHFCKSDDDLIKSCDNFSKGSVIVLDENGTVFTSRYAPTIAYFPKARSKSIN